MPAGTWRYRLAWMKFGHGSLRAWLTAVVVLTVLVVVGVGAYTDYRREYRVHFKGVFASLEEQAHALKAARGQITDKTAFARHVDEFCARMNEFVSPGHHILVLDTRGHVAAQAQHHSGVDVGRALLAADPSETVLTLPNHRLALVRLRDDDGATIVVAQYLDHLEQIVRTQVISRVITAAVMAAALIVLLALAIHLWVHVPLTRLEGAGRAWAGRDFRARAKVSGPADLRGVVAQFNAMAAQLDEHERERLAGLERARHIQANLLPSGPPPVTDLAVATAYRPAEHVGGDLYDLFGLRSGNTAITVTDVASHGVSAALLTGVVKMALRARFAEQEKPAEVMAAVNGDLLACLDTDQFVTACVGVWDHTARTWTYASAGHPGGLLVRDGAVERLESTGFPLGISAAGTWEQRTMALPDGARLFLYTDGVTDAGVPTDALGDTGLARLLENTVDDSVQDQVARIIAAVKERSGSTLLDDATLLAFEVLPPVPRTGLPPACATRGASGR